MPKVVIYTTPFCPYCLMAKRLLAKKGVAFEEIDVSGNWDLRDELVTRSGGRMTVPQIWIGETHVGGSDELMRWNARASSTPCWRRSAVPVEAELLIHTPRCHPGPCARDPSIG